MSLVQVDLAWQAQAMRLSWLPAVILLFFAGSAVAEEAAECFDLAVIASVGKAVPREVESEPDVIITRWPWDLPLKVLQVVAGEEPRRRLPVVMGLHSGLNPRIKTALFLLRQEDDGAYHVINFEPYVVRDHKGRFVLPIISPRGVKEYDWMSRDYAELLKPIRYRPADAWWLAGDYAGLEESRAVMAGRALERSGRIIALQGIYLDDLARHPTFLSRRCRR